MRPDEALLVQRAAAYTAAYLRQDQNALALQQPELENAQRAPDGFVLLAILAAETAALARSATFDHVLDDIDGPSPEFPPNMINRAAVVTLARAVKVGDATARDAAAASLGERGTALMSAFDLALSAVRYLEQATSRDGAEWCATWAVGAAAGIGVEPTEPHSTQGD